MYISFIMQLSRYKFASCIALFLSVCPSVCPMPATNSEKLQQARSWQRVPRHVWVMKQMSDQKVKI